MPPLRPHELDLKMHEDASSCAIQATMLCQQGGVLHVAPFKASERMGAISELSSKDAMVPDRSIFAYAMPMFSGIRRVNGRPVVTFTM